MDWTGALAGDALRRGATRVRKDGVGRIALGRKCWWGAHVKNMKSLARLTYWLNVFCLLEVLWRQVNSSRNGYWLD